jgi:zinc finger SWIM domain-containing protein 3
MSTLYRQEYGGDPPFNYQDVYHSINPHGYQQALDTTGYIQHLQHNKDEEGLDFSYKHDAEGVLCLCFNVFKDAVKLFSDGCRPVLFDTKHGTNRYGLRLGCFTTVGRDGGTVLLATLLMQHEDQQSFEWAFLQFKLFFGAQSHCMFTDGDKAMAAAMKTTLPATMHYLCIWHLSQTIIKNAKGNIQFLHTIFFLSCTT